MVLESSSPKPQARDMASLVPVGPKHLMLFGGRGEYSKTLNDLWLLDLERYGYSSFEVMAESGWSREGMACKTFTLRCNALYTEAESG